MTIWTWVLSAKSDNRNSKSNASFTLIYGVFLAKGSQARNETKHTWTECHGWEQQSYIEGVSEGASLAVEKQHSAPHCQSADV